MSKLYTKDHFWLEEVKEDSPLRSAILPALTQPNLYIFGASQHGIDELGEVVSVDVYQGHYKPTETFGTIESRKAVVDLMIDAPCELIRENTLISMDEAHYLNSLNKTPEHVWIALLQINDPEYFKEEVLSEDEYKTYLEQTKHK